MKIIKEIERIDKEDLFNLYTKLVEDFKDFEDITSEEMLDEILEIYKDYENIIDLCTYEELEYLKEIQKKKGKNITIKAGIESDLMEKFMLFYDTDKRVIPEEIEEIVKKAIKKVDKQEKLAIDSLNGILVGLMKIYGILSPEKISEIIKEKLKIAKEEILNHIENSRYFKFYAYKVNYEDKDYFMFEPYYYFEEALVHTLDIYNDLEYADYNFETIFDERFNIFNLNKESILKFIKKVEACKIIPYELYHKIIEYSVLDYKREELADFINQMKGIKKKDKEELIRLLEKAMNDMPSAALKGHTPNDLMHKKMQEEYDKHYKKTWNKTKENETIQDYKALREETESLFEDCIMYLMKNYHEQMNQLSKIVIKNEIKYEIEDSNILNNLILFHSLKEEENLFSTYIQKGMNILSKKYKIAWQVEESLTESLFQVKKLSPNSGTVKLLDLKTKKEYLMYDVAFSSGSKNLEGSYIYTTLLTVNKLTFANGYAFIFLKENHEDIEKEIEKMKKTIIGVENDKTKSFLACHKLFKKEDIVFSARPLE